MSRKGARAINNSNILEAHFYGYEQPYDHMLALMHEIHKSVAHKERPAHLMLLEHQAVITITRQHQGRSIKTSEEHIKQSGIALHVADRGGDVTFHGPGQLVGYAIINIIDIESYVRGLENALFKALKNLGLENVLLQKGFTGIWYKTRVQGKIEMKKLIAIGVGIKDGASKHGFAINFSIDKSPFLEHIVPCGLKERGVFTLSEAFFLESLPLPDYLAMVSAVAQSIAEAFSLTLSWSESSGLMHTKGAPIHG